MNTATRQHKNIVGLRDLRENMETYITRVRKGESLTIVRRSEPIFHITPVDAGDEDGWETVIDFSKIRKGGVPVADVRTAIQKILSR